MATAGGCTLWRRWRATPQTTNPFSLWRCWLSNGGYARQRQLHAALSVIHWLASNRSQKKKKRKCFELFVEPQQRDEQLCHWHSPAWLTWWGRQAGQVLGRQPMVCKLYCRPAGGAVPLVAVPFFPCFEVNDSERNDFKKSDLMCGKKLCCCFKDFHILMFLLLPDGLWKVHDMFLCVVLFSDLHHRGTFRLFIYL